MTSCQPYTRRQRYFWHLFTGDTLHMVLVARFINVFVCCNLLDAATVVELFLCGFLVWMMLLDTVCDFPLGCPYDFPCDAPWTVLAPCNGASVVIY